MYVSARTRLFQVSLILLVVVSAAAAAIRDDSDWAQPGVNVVSGQLYLKLDASITPLKITFYENTPLTGVASLDAVAAMYGVTNMEQTFIGETTPKNPKDIDLSGYYSVYFPEELDPTAVGETYEECKEVIFAEHVRLTRIEFVPNDPRYNAQWHLDKCEFPGAWEYTRGSREVVIGIVDSGMDMPYDDNGGDTQVHEDIAGNLWMNPGEDIDHDGILTVDDWNGEDDDNNGFPDDFHGWDLTGRDNWPDDPHGGQGGVGHGTHVAGIASATTNNGVGISGAAFSASIMVAGCYTVANDEMISNGYPGINYCVRAGAKVINLSWGSRSAPSNAERDVINNAINRGVMVFAAAGNDSLQDLRANRVHHYPSSYDGVFTIAASGSDDRKTDFSVYGDFIDLVAPGDNILSTIPHNRYTFYPGTSMASPLAAGLGALMLSIEPALTYQELLEWMQRTSTDISELNNLNGINYRINADFLINSTHPKYEISDWGILEVGGNGDGRADPNEQISIEFVLNNIAGYQNAFGTYAELSNPDTMVRIENPRIDLGDLNAGETLFSDGENTLRFRVRYRSIPHYSTFTVTVGDAGEFRKSFDIPMTIGHPNYLLVDDDEGSDYEKYYTQDLAVRPVVHDTWTVADQGVPPIAYLRGYDNVLWVTGNSRNGLSAAEQAILINWLDSPNHQGLVLSGQYLAEDIGETEFHTNYLHARMVNANTGGRQLTGALDNPISNGVSLLLIGGAGAGNNQSPNSLEPINGADTLLTYNNVGGVGAVFYTSDSYSIVYTGFSLEAASGMAQTTPRSEFITRCFDRFYVLDAPIEQPAGPTQFSLTAPWPNPFNGQARIQVAAPNQKSYRLEVTDLAGRTIAVLNDGKISGSGSFTWNADALPAGIYLFRLSWDGGMAIQKAALVK